MLQTEIERVAELIRGIKVATLTSIGEDGLLHSRPMATQEIDFNGSLWFFTSRHSHKVEDVEFNSHVNLNYAAPDKNRYVCLAGKASLVRDDEKAAALWSPALKPWFPRGLHDPELALLKVEVERVESW